jgi:hypothetical protein
MIRPSLQQALQDTLPSRKASVESQRATWASSLSRPRALQPKSPANDRRPSLQQARKTRCRAVNRCFASAVLLRAMWPAFQIDQELFSPSAGNDIAPLAAASAQDTLPHRPQVFGDRGVASCDVGQLFKPPKGSPAQAPATAWCSLPQ